MAKLNKVQFTDQDGDELHVSTWPVVPGFVFESRMKGEKHGAMVELSPQQARELIKFLESAK